MRRSLLVAVLVGAAAIAGCSDSGGSEGVEQQIRRVAREQGLQGSPALREPELTAAQQEIRELRRELGRNLFSDKIMSGVEQTTCATCHHPAFQFADGRNIARGVYCDLTPTGEQIICRDAPAAEAGNVVGPDRTAPLNSRNSPSLLNSALFPRQMWNGRFHFIDESSKDVNQCDATLGFELPPPERVMLTRSILTAQAHIPVTEAVEMTGDFPHFNEPFEDRDELNPEIRDGISFRISDDPGYRPLFEEAYPAGRPEVKLYPGDPEIGPGEDIPYLAIADSIAHFLETLVMTDSPWDRFLAGDDSAIDDAAKRGALTFFGEGQCSSCHSGDLFTDFENHNIGVPQVGPGTTQYDPEPIFNDLRTWDYGLEEVSFRRTDRFKYRTPPLRGVALTGPYMHNGAYATLEDTIRHHVDPAAAYQSYDISQIEADMRDADGIKPMAAVFERRNPVVLGPNPGQTRIDLSEEQIADLVQFLVALTDPRMKETDSLAPETVPSGLPVDVVGPRRFPIYE
ncbi:MAG TPA: cytochrome c peroxidase [Terriglobales bacterium]|nr:cytochrome c peroxidase [Terriglobales bacterium]